MADEKKPPHLPHNPPKKEAKQLNTAMFKAAVHKGNKAIRGLLEQVSDDKNDLMFALDRLMQGLLNKEPINIPQCFDQIDTLLSKLPKNNTRDQLKIALYDLYENYAGYQTTSETQASLAVRVFRKEKNYYDIHAFMEDIRTQQCPVNAYIYI